MRTNWNRVVSCLNFKYGESKIEYRLPRHDPTTESDLTNENELKSGLINFTKVFTAILGVCYPGYTGIGDVISFLRKLFECINLEQKYDMKYKGSTSFWNSDIYGELSVKVDKYSNAFTIRQFAGHGRVKLEDNSKNNSTKVVFDYEEHKYNYLCGYLYPHYAKQNMYHTIFSHAYRNIPDYKIASSFYFYKKYKNEEKKRKALMTVIMNQMSSIPLNNAGRCENVRGAFIVGIGGDLLLTKTILDDTNTLKPHFDCTVDFITQVLNNKFINKNKELIISFCNYSKYNLSFLEKIDVNDPNIAGVVISSAKTPEIISLPPNCHVEFFDCGNFLGNLNGVSKVTIGSSLHYNFPLMDFSSLPVSLEELGISGCTPVTPIDLSKLINLKKLKISGSNVDFPSLPALEELAISNYYESETSIDLSKLMNLKKLKISGSNVDFPSLPASLHELDIYNYKPVAPIDLSKLENLKKITARSSNIDLSTIPASAQRDIR